MTAAMLEDRPELDPDPLREAVREAYRADETACVELLLAQAAMDDGQRERVRARAHGLAARVRAARGDQPGIEAFLHEYRLSTPEGVMLMCLAEALLRIPDADTADRLIRDKLGGGDWAGHLGHSGSLLVNASTWGLMLTGRFSQIDLDEDSVGTGFSRLVRRLGEPVVRKANGSTTPR
jgi:RHH-type proline utilization regulon transcriptional repressor/proline dehydrogenase/delta 1-pyrroline-5-carboxylate dehydrogenase